ncbi:MAG: MFS transporter [Chloroflexi bacterium]|nr:MFS transporter [Chloroflexota bacterium]
MTIRLSPLGRIIVSIYLPSVLMGFGMGMLLPTLPIVARSFGVAPEVAAQGVTAYLIGRVACLFPAGYIVDRYGRRFAMVLGPSIVVLGLACTVLTPWFSLVLVGQALVGSGEGIWSLGREIAAVESIRAEQRGRVIAAFFGVSAGGATVGPVLGGRLADLFGYGVVFMAAGLFAVAVGAIGWTYRPSPRSAGHSARPRVAESSEPPRGGRRSPFSTIAPGYLRTFQVVMFATFCAMLRSTSVQSLLPVHVVSDLGYTASDVGYLFGLTGLVQMLMIVPAGFISDKIGRKAAVVPAAALAGASFVGYAVSTEPLGLAVASVLMGLSAGLAIGTMTSFTYDIVSPDARGSIQAFRRSVGEVGSLSGPILGGLIAGLSSASMAFAIFAPLHLVSSLLVAFVARETLNRRPSPEPRAVRTSGA